ncbi:MAG: hypothetical protein IKR75_08170 [Fibrobacter sp.]|uniref:hypothetical protein n=1 Tax=uncultured Fibrobacter sp. TaxID=261512 RepID=UPI0015659FE3|nr:hypothetical protein [uncultured Fibrobacter sp.]MBQ1824161.1 hypothetical protein [Fibrobacter sp.]MBR6318380.1 hypothetical protein [Fibrobacter sp.]
MIRSGSFAGRIAALLVMLLMTLGLTGCLSHWFLDSSTRLQVENRTKFDVVSIDIISEDHTSIKPWIKDTVRSGEKSRVYEEDWVGSFQARFVFLASDSVKRNVVKEYRADMDFDGGSLYMVLYEDKDGAIHYEFR